MATIKKCDRCGRARPGKYHRVQLQTAEQDNEGAAERDIEIPDCCETCLNTITKCVTLKKKPRKAKPRGNAKPRQRKPRGKSNSQRTDDFDANANTQSTLPTPNGAPVKPSVPPPPEG